MVTWQIAGVTNVFTSWYTPDGTHPGPHPGPTWDPTGPHPDAPACLTWQVLVYEELSEPVVLKGVGASASTRSRLRAPNARLLAAASLH